VDGASETGRAQRWVCEGLGDASRHDPPKRPRGIRIMGDTGCAGLRRERAAKTGLRPWRTSCERGSAWAGNRRGVRAGGSRRFRVGWPSSAAGRPRVAVRAPLMPGAQWMSAPEGMALAQMPSRRSQSIRNHSVREPPMSMHRTGASAMEASRRARSRAAATAFRAAPQARSASPARTERCPYA
jgi:hypothetical protein